MSEAVGAAELVESARASISLLEEQQLRARHVRVAPSTWDVLDAAMPGGRSLTPVGAKMFGLPIYLDDSMSHGRVKVT